MLSDLSTQFFITSLKKGSTLDRKQIDRKCLTSSSVFSLEIESYDTLNMPFVNIKNGIVKSIF